ncbi:MAG: acyl-CoA thioesterase [Bacillota bacterium]
MNTNKTVFRVRYQETDQMGFAYHANYLIWFEMGRTELMRNFGLPYIEFEKNNLYLPVLKAYCEYKHAVRYDDEISVLTHLKSLENVRLVFNYELQKDGRKMAFGYTEHAFINKAGRPVVMKKVSPFLWHRLCKALEENS